jgi:hypothetical protein
MSYIPKENPLPIKKIYVDSARRVNNTFSQSSDFTIELPMSISFPEYSTCYVSDISIPFSWRTVDAGVNDKLYVRICVTEGVFLTTVATTYALTKKANAGVVRVLDTVLTLTSSVYSGQSLATELASQINKAYLTIPTGERNFNMKDLLSTNYLKVTYDQTANTLKIGVDNTMNTANSFLQLRFFTDDEMRKMKYTRSAFRSRLEIDSKLFNEYSIFGAPFDPNNLQSANEVIGNKRNPQICGVDLASTLPSLKVVYSTWTTGFLNLLRHMDLYLCSEDLTSFRTFGPNGETSIIKKIPVTVSYGGIIVSETVLPGDYIELGSKTIKQLRFRLMGSDGRLLDLHGGNVSFSLVFNNAS